MPDVGGAAVELRDIRKSFGGTRALRGVTFAAQAGEVTALVGENGAGKSTLLSVLSGVIPADGGEIRIGGYTRELRSPREAQAAGIAIIHQGWPACGNSQSWRRCTARDRIRD